MSDLLPAIPAPGSPVSASEVERLELQVAEAVGDVNDLPTLDEWRNQAAALEAYLRGRELQHPMLGAQRRIEARIGMLDEVGYHGNHGINNKLIAEFRTLARALSGECDLEPEEWRRSRRALVAEVRRRVGKAEIPRARASYNGPAGEIVAHRPEPDPDADQLRGEIEEAQEAVDAAERDLVAARRRLDKHRRSQAPDPFGLLWHSPGSQLVTPAGDVFASDSDGEVVRYLGRGAPHRPGWSAWGDEAS